MDDRPNVAFLLHDVARRFRLRFDERARSLGVTRQQWRVLFNLARQPGQSQAEVADALEVERITLCRMVDRLAESGHVERRGDPADRRVWRLHLTPASERIVDQLTAIGRELEDEALSGLDPRERKELVDTLERVRSQIAARETQGKAVLA